MRALAWLAVLLLIAVAVLFVVTPPWPHYSCAWLCN